MRPDEKNSIGLFLAVAALLITATISLPSAGRGCMWRGSGGWGPEAQIHRMYYTEDG